jgi:hypothetical protein
MPGAAGVRLTHPLPDCNLTKKARAPLYSALIWAEHDEVRNLGLTPLGAGFRPSNGWKNLGYWVGSSALLYKSDSTITFTVTPQLGCNLIEKYQTLSSLVQSWAERDRRGNLRGMVQLGSHFGSEHECRECGGPRHEGIAGWTMVGHRALIPVRHIPVGGGVNLSSIRANIILKVSSVFSGGNRASVLPRHTPGGKGEDLRGAGVRSREDPINNRTHKDVGGHDKV